MWKFRQEDLQSTPEGPVCLILLLALQMQAGGSPVSMHTDALHPPVLDLPSVRMASVHMQAPGLEAQTGKRAIVPE